MGRRGGEGIGREGQWKPDFPRGTLVLYSRVDDPCHFVSYGIAGIPTDYTWIPNSFLEAGPNVEIGRIGGRLLRSTVVLFAKCRGCSMVTAFISRLLLSIS